MRPLSISYTELFLLSLAGKPNLTNPASATIDARCGYFAQAIVGFRDVRPDPGGASDDRKVTGFGCSGPSDKVSDWISDRLAEGHAGIGAWEVDYSALVSSPRWYFVITP
jgi:hypothetical protein